MASLEEHLSKHDGTFEKEKENRFLEKNWERSIYRRVYTHLVYYIVAGTILLCFSDAKIVNILLKIASGIGILLFLYFLFHYLREKSK